MRKQHTQGIFISYRRDDAPGFARSLHDRLCEVFGNEQVFMDVEDLRTPGIDFVDAINRKLENCTALIALIGQHWVVDKAGNRLFEEENDFVQLEVGAALERQTIPVLPLLVNDAEMPEGKDLPANLASLGRRQALSLSHADWKQDTDKVVRALEVFGVKPRPPSTPFWTGKKVSVAVGGAIAATLALVAVWAGMVWMMNLGKNPAERPQQLLQGDPKSTNAAPTKGDAVVGGGKLPPHSAPERVPNLAGNWSDNNSVQYYFDQKAEFISVSQLNVLSNTFVPIGSGTYANGELVIRYTNTLGQSGTVTSTLAPDGRHLNGYDQLDGAPMSVPNQWHHEHFPGQ